MKNRLLLSIFLCLLGVQAFAGTISGASSVCANATITLSDGTSPSVTWSSSNTLIATVSPSGNPVTVTGVPGSSGTITITNSLGDSKAITVNVAPTVTGSPSTTVYEGPGGLACTVTLNATPSGGSFTPAYYLFWGTIGGTSGVITPSNDGTGVKNVTYTLSDGCKYVIAVTVASFPNPVVSNTSNHVCTGATMTVTDAVLGGTWSAASSNFSVTGTGPGAAVITGVTATAGSATNVIYTLASEGAGCYRSSPVYVDASPGAITGPSSVCVGSTITLSEGSGGGGAYGELDKQHYVGSQHIGDRNRGQRKRLWRCCGNSNNYLFHPSHHWQLYRYGCSHRDHHAFGNQRDIDGLCWVD